MFFIECRNCGRTGIANLYTGSAIPTGWLEHIYISINQTTSPPNIHNEINALYHMNCKIYIYIQSQVHAIYVKYHLYVPLHINIKGYFCLKRPTGDKWGAGAQSLSSKC